ncbi:lipopolysaccharide biosynthesis protein [Dyadobacter sp. 676]|uniref:Lipopolysaccharide biosynthesis protein n=1 Tax=Dyadobacter sp. 676 TaxID=3088362 RepID=A0AAU8FPT0_9BACT
MQVQQEIKKGAITVFITKYSGIVIGLIVNSILARLLSPSEFGVVGVITVFIAFFNILSDIGLGVAIVQNQDLGKKDISDIFKLSFFLSVMLAVCFAGLSYAIAWFYQNDIYLIISKLLAINVLFSALTVVPKNLLIKAKAFKTIGAVEVSVSLVTGVLAIFMANADWSYYAIVWRSIISSMGIFFLCLYFSGLKVQRGFSLKAARKVARYSMNQFAFNFINYFSRNLDNILIGKYMGSQSLGIYNQAYQLMTYPISNLTHVITPVLHPVLAQFQHNVQVIFTEYMKVVKILAAIGIPISIFVYFSSDEIIYLVLGERWMEVVPILRVLSISIWVQMISSSAGAIFQATGRTDILFRLGLSCSAIMIVAIVTGTLVFKSLIVTAYALVIAFWVSFVLIFFVLLHYIFRQPASVFFSAIAKHFGLALAMIAGLWINSHQAAFQIVDAQSALISLSIKSAIAFIIFSLFNISLIRKYLPGVPNPKL